MKRNILIHIPHSSLELPQEFLDNITVDKDYIQEENIFISDYMIDKFIPNNNCFYVIKFNYSRLFCDVERFKDDSLEVMSKRGMGVVYTKDSNGKDFIKINNNYKNAVISKYYNYHHKKLDDLTEEIINKYGKCLIIDLHSFSDEFVDKMFNYKDNPDICLGCDSNFTDKETLLFLQEHFNRYGYSVKINYPYSGTIVPNKYFNADNSFVNSIMIEINKRIYLDNNKCLNKEKYKKLKKCMDDMYINIS